MDIEEIAKIELFLKSQQGLDNLLNVEKLIVVEKDENAINKLKDGAYKLHSLDNSSSQELKETWQNLFTKQVKFSVNRAKNMKK